MRRISISVGILTIMPCFLFSQSLELMAGHEKIFADAQWLRFFDEEKYFSLFSRSRATVDYNNNTDLFTGAYLNYTSNIGLGGSIVGKIDSREGGVDIGPHIFKSQKNWMLFGLASMSIKSDFQFSWFSIFRITPYLKENIRLYSSTELFSVFLNNGHLASIQRLRLGLWLYKFQFGISTNLTETRYLDRFNHNTGFFIRTSF